MRVLIISDTHGRHTAFDRAIMEAGKIDYLVHLGDTEGGEDYIEAFCGCPAYILAGNNDFFSRNLREMEIYFGKKKFCWKKDYFDSVYFNDVCLTGIGYSLSNL